MILSPGDEGDKEYYVKCDSCGLISELEASGEYKTYYEPRDFWHREYFHGRNSSIKNFILDKDFCRKCAIKMTPWVCRLRDIDELNKFVGQLGRVISGKRNQNNGSVAHIIGKCSEQRYERKYGHQTSRNATQTG